ncbi:MAG TPA: DNA polymerase III subunit chi [Candidatus Competibacteraceae bacterium]|nr:DNA polymerase III subunit chi [Candidatus Competibacteraceae bacterium]
MDFYLLPQADPEARLDTVCRLAEKAYALGQRVYIHADSAEQARVLDERLWTFRDGSFVPHALEPAIGDELSPVRIGWQGAPTDFRQVLINLTAAMPTELGEFERILEVLDQRPEVLASGRERFRRYRELGLEPHTHRLS